MSPHNSQDVDSDIDNSSNEIGVNLPVVQVQAVVPDRPVPTEICQPQQPQDVNHFSDDEFSGEIDRDYKGYFEGPEKTLEVCFRKINTQANISGTGEITEDAARESVPNHKAGLRQLSRSDLDVVCARARCTILSCISNQYVDAYVLSESSLFVYPYMIVLKTCGTTTLLRCIAKLIDLGRSLGLEIDWVGYSRKNFNFPGDQAFPHQSFHQELEYLSSHRRLCERLDGNGYTLGPVTGDHWFVFVADHTIRAKTTDDTDRVLNIMMFDIDEDVSNLFHYEPYVNGSKKKKDETKEEEMIRISKEQTIASGINNLCPGAVIDAAAFEPCGYSMNAILFRSYSTIHITPESGSSYASFETNQKLTSYKSLISNVIRTFRPKRFVMTLMADEAGLKQISDNPLTDTGSAARIVAPVKVDKQNKLFCYKRSQMASIKVEEDCCCLMGNWDLMQSSAEKNPLSGNGLTIGRPRGMSVS